jgi:AbrB family looped-hinge helix DNA binding protein
MNLERTITEKGQVVIPKDIRDQLGLKPGSEILFEIEDGKVIIRKKTDGERTAEEFFSVIPEEKKLKSLTIKEIKSILDEQYDLP